MVDFKVRPLASVNPVKEWTDVEQSGTPSPNLGADTLLSSRQVK